MRGPAFGLDAGRTHAYARSSTRQNGSQIGPRPGRLPRGSRQICSRQLAFRLACVCLLVQRQAHEGDLQPDTQMQGRQRGRYRPLQDRLLPADACAPKPLLPSVEQALEEVVFATVREGSPSPGSPASLGAPSSPSPALPTSTTWAPQAATQGLPGGGGLCEGSPLLWPIDPKAVTATVPFVEGSHPGVELAAAPGTRIYAAHAGFMLSSIMGESE